MQFNANEALRDTLAALRDFNAPWWAIILILVIVMSPILIPVLSGALAEHRKLSQKRDQGYQKIRNSLEDVNRRRSQTPPPQRRLGGPGGGEPS